MTVSHLHSVLKSLSYRIFGSLATTAISFIFTDSTTISLSIGLADFCTKFVLYYVHERAWLFLK